MEITDKYPYFEGIAPSGYVKLDDKKISPDVEHLIIGLTGDCMDSDLSPIRIRHGDKLLIHFVPIKESEIIKNIGKVIAFKYSNDVIYTKQLVSYSKNYILIRLFKPHEKFFYVPINKIKALFVVDDVISPEYIKQNLYKI